MPEEERCSFLDVGDRLVCIPKFEFELPECPAGRVRLCRECFAKNQRGFLSYVELKLGGGAAHEWKDKKLVAPGWLSLVGYVLMLK